jgi:hypothetical protein
MSAYLCADAHISALAAYAVHHKLWEPDLRALNEERFSSKTDAEILGERMHAANVESLRELYYGNAT